MDRTQTPRDYLASIGPRQRGGENAGIYSICSSHPMVLEAAFARAKADHSPLLIEATCNQVNQFGGYTGMTPADFAAYIYRTAEQTGFDPQRLMIGGDHLGPHVWRNQPAESAMDKAGSLVAKCVSAGYGKIHLDASMPLGDDSGGTVATEISAKRAARLCRAAEQAAQRTAPGVATPLYVIGAEVPTPGGSLAGEKDVPVSSPNEVAEFMNACERVFQASGLADAWTRVIGVVVQPGVDFGEMWVKPYHRQDAEPLSQFHDRLAGAVTYEIHATDYQSPQALSEMVADHFALLKVGPCLSFAFREAVFALDHIEQEWLGSRKSIEAADVRNRLQQIMDANPGYWHSHHSVDSASDWHVLFSYLDRVRYYWAWSELERALSRLIQNLSREPIPMPLLRQYLPEQARTVAADHIAAEPAALIRHKIRTALSPHATACRMSQQI